MKILVTGAGAVLGQAIIKSLLLMKEKNKEITIIAVDPNPLSVGLFWSDKTYKIPMAKDSNYLDEFIKIIEIEKPKLVFVGTDTELPILSKNKKMIFTKYDSTIIISDYDVIEIADDKWLTYEFLNRYNFDAPISTINKSIEEIEKLLKYPLIVKPRIGARSIGVDVIKNRNDLIDKISRTDDVIFQEYLDSSKEYTAGVVYFGESNLASIVMERQLKDGNTFIAKPIKYSWINEYLEKVARKLNVFGPVNFQFKVQDNHIKIFEINSRFSGTTHFRNLSGFNEVEMCVMFLLENQAINQPNIESNIAILRYYNEIVVPIK